MFLERFPDEFLLEQRMYLNEDDFCFFFGGYEDMEIVGYIPVELADKIKGEFNICYEGVTYGIVTHRPKVGVYLIHTDMTSHQLYGNMIDAITKCKKVIIPDYDTFVPYMGEE